MLDVFKLFERNLYYSNTFYFAIILEYIFLKVLGTSWTLRQQFGTIENIGCDSMSKIDDINRLIIESKLSGEIFTKEISDGTDYRLQEGQKKQEKVKTLTKQPDDNQ